MIDIEITDVNVDLDLNVFLKFWTRGVDSLY